MNSQQPNSSDGERVWEGGWEDHELQQLRRLAKLTMAQKLQWLEEAQRLVMRMSRAESDRKKGKVFHGHQDDSTQPPEGEPESDAG